MKGSIRIHQLSPPAIIRQQQNSHQKLYSHRGVPQYHPVVIFATNKQAINISMNFKNQTKALVLNLPDLNGQILLQFCWSYASILSFLAYDTTQQHAYFSKLTRTDQLHKHSITNPLPPSQPYHLININPCLLLQTSNDQLQIKIDQVLIQKPLQIINHLSLLSQYLPQVIISTNQKIVNLYLKGLMRTIKQSENEFKYIINRIHIDGIQSDDQVKALITATMLRFNDAEPMVKLFVDNYITIRVKLAGEGQQFRRILTVKLYASFPQLVQSPETQPSDKVINQFFQDIRVSSEKRRLARSVNQWINNILHNNNERIKHFEGYEVLGRKRLKDTLNDLMIDKMLIRGSRIRHINYIIRQIIGDGNDVVIVIEMTQAFFRWIHTLLPQDRYCCYFLDQQTGDFIEYMFLQVIDHKQEIIIEVT